MTINDQGHETNGAYSSRIEDMHTAHTNGKNPMPDCKREPLAIVGMACRFAGDATSPEKLWDLVSQGRDAWSSVPKDRFNLEAFYHPQSDRLSTISMKGGYFLQEDPALFDTSFFNLTTEVAAAMDPQIRIQLETVFEALESAGMPLSSVIGSKTSVFTGSFSQDYYDIQLRDPLHMPRAFLTGNYAAMLANRISHFFDLKGPSVTVDTGCSTSLVGLHLAVQSLREGDSECAIVGGACLNLNPIASVDLANLGTCGPDARCFAFDERAQGYGRGEGIAAIVLKPLSKAIRDGDAIRAIIRETASNQDGHTPTITTPSVDAQRELIRDCYARAELDPLDTTVVEAHGTGTRAGDPIEAKAIGDMIGAKREQPLCIGSVKTNLGHTEATSGLAAIIKMVMALEHRQIPPSLNFEKPNPDINFQDLRLKVPTRLEEWESKGPRRVSINNFGYGGTNTHVIMEEAPKISPVPPKCNSLPSHQLFLLSARHPSSAQQMAANLKGYLESCQDRFADPAAFSNLAFTLTERRTRFPWMLAVSASNTAELIEALETKEVQNYDSSDKPLRLGFVFNGQGSQSYNMGRELSASYPVYKQALNECDDIIRSFGADWSLIEELERSKETTRVNEVRFSMPTTCAVQLALLRLLSDFGIKPAAVTGHSSGEIAAAFATGALTLRDAMAAAYFRGLVTAEHLATSASEMPGGMLAVGLGASDVKPHIASTSSGKVVVACENSPSSVTLSGDMAYIEELAAKFSSMGIFARKLVVSTAFHSHHMFPLQQEYRNALQENMRKHRRYSGNVSFVSSVTGMRVENAQSLGPDYWVQNMTHPVLFSDSFRNMVAIEQVNGEVTQFVDAVVEIGPHGVLAGPIRQCLTSTSLKNFSIPYIASLYRGRHAVLTIQDVAGFALSRGSSVNVSCVNTPNGRKGLRPVTGLPSYAWNHTQRFWHESRMSIEHRFQQNPHHDLLGVRLAGTSDKSPIWRYVIRASELPWVRDHVIQGEMVFPGSAYITMVIEAMRQLNAPKSTVCGYLLEEFEILRATVLHEDNQGTELQLFFEPVSEKTLDASKRVFRIYSAASDGTWTEAARGYITVDLDKTRPIPALRSTLEIDRAAACHKSETPETFYQSLASTGVNYGQSFQVISHISKSTDGSVTTLVVPDSAIHMPYNWQQPHVIHPITLDGIFQAAYAPLSEKVQSEIGTAVPRSIKSLFISSDIDSQPGINLQAHSSLLRYNRQGFDTSIVVQPSDRTEGMVIEVDGIHFRSIGIASSDNSDAQMKICAFEEWVPSVQLNKPHDVFGKQLQRAGDSTEISISQDITRATYYMISDAMTTLTPEDIAQLEWYHKLFYDWMQLQLQLAEQDKLSPRSSKWARATPGAKAALIDRVTESSTNGMMTTRVGQKLVAILRKEVMPLDLMLEGDLLYRFYREMLHFTQSAEQVAQVAKNVTLENPKARILEIGGGTGGCTVPVLSALGNNGVEPPSFEHYVFTDISPGFFQTARDRFAEFGDLISYQTLDIENDPAEQGFNEKYDLIIAAQVLHATKSLSKTLRNVRKLLKDNGKLVMIETTQDTIDVSLIFGTLPGWWLSEEPERKYSPNMPARQWNSYLLEAGFTGVDMELWDCQEEEHMTSSVIMSTAIPGNSPVYCKEVTLLHYDSDLSVQWLEGLAQRVKVLTGCLPEVVPLEEANIGDKYYIFLTGINKIDKTSQSFNFDLVKRLVIKSGGFLWVTTGSAEDCELPVHALHKGFLRTCRIEYSSNIFGSLDLDLSRGLDLETQNTIVKVFSNIFNTNAAAPKDFEYAERKGQILLPRLKRDVVENEKFINDDKKTCMQEFVQNVHNRRALKLEVTRPGLLDSIVFRDDETFHSPLSDDWIEVEPHAYGINFHDVMSAMGQLDEKQELGTEAAGIITRVGPNATHQLSPGMRVIALTPHGHISTRVRVPWHNVVAMPEGMEFSDAASVATVFATAYYSMFDVARVEPGETMLVHAAAGGVGQACIILAKWKGIKILATVGSPKKRAFLIKTYGLADEQIFSSRDESFVSGVLDATNQKGVDVVINSLAGSLLNATWNIVAQHGRFIEIGKRDIHSNKAIEMRPFRKAVSFSAVDLIQLCDTRGHIVQRTLVAVMELLKAKTIRVISPIVTYPVSDIARAFRTMQAGKHIGKMVAVPHSKDMVKTLPLTDAAKLSPKASYLIIGGLGGIGRSCARWMVQQGAKHLIILSRSVATNPNAASLKKELTALGANIMLRDCDASDIASLKVILSECTTDMPPIRGIIHCGMVLNDSVLERMSSVQWADALDTKVSVTQNLHYLFPDADDLDFFLLLSSILGVIGSASQANYTAGGAFQDALARHRASKGLPCVAIDLGFVEGIGYLAESKAGLTERWLARGHRLLCESEILQLLDYCVRHPIRTPRTAQVISGIQSSAIRKEAWGNEMRYAALCDDDARGHAVSSSTGSDKSKIGLREQLSRAANVEEAGEIVEKAVVGKLSDMFVIPVENIDVEKSLAQYGVDSLVAVELKNWLVPMTGCEMSIFELLGTTSLRGLAGGIAERRGGGKGT